MTAVVLITRPEAVYLFSDGMESSLETGHFGGFANKAVAIPHCRSAFVVRGDGALTTAFHEALSSCAY